jgi:CTP synthase
MKYIFVTGGVVSGIGKGITAASIGLLLKSSGYSVDAIKFDPYLNIDPGTMSPFEHGEVYVLDDGSETDLDLGHYERFLDVNLDSGSSVTAGKIYNQILKDERNGKYLGKNVQLIPNVTDKIKSCFKNSEKKFDIRIIEIGGSTGDMEGEIFLESFRQFHLENPGDVFHVHLGYIPFLACSGEYKSKPMQRSIRELLRVGLQPDLLIARWEPIPSQNLGKNILDKIALFGNLHSDAVISLPDLGSIYNVPVYLQKTTIQKKLETFLGKKLNIKLPKFYTNFEKDNSKKSVVKIGIVVKYTKLEDSYLSVIEALKAAVFSCNKALEYYLIDSESDDLEKQIKNMDGVVVPGGFGKRGMEGKIKAIEIVRKTKKPFLGICLGLQMAVIEFARNELKLDVYSQEMFEEEGQNNKNQSNQMIIDYMPGQNDIRKKGGTMRLGGYDCNLASGSKISSLFSGKKIIRERHRHRLEVQNQYVTDLEKNGLKIVGKFPYKDSFLVEMIELDSKLHPFFVATQSHPEFLSRPNIPHPLFVGLIKACTKTK